jgi:hypothetical protein
MDGLLREDGIMSQTVPVRLVPGYLPRPRRWLVALLVGLALSVGLTLEAQAATTWTVCASGCDYASIKAAIAAPTTLNGDTLAIAAGTYTEPGIVVNKSLTLKGETAATTIVQAAATKGKAPDRVFTIPSGVSVTIWGLTIRYGHVEDGDGGGLYNAGTLTLTNSTIRGNTATSGGGLANWGTVILTHSIVAKNPDGSDCRNGTIHGCCQGMTVSQGYNLDSDGSCRLTAATDRPGTDPLLGPLQDHGGPTFTQALLPGSPAIDVIPWGTNGCGTTVVSDQRGQARPQPLGGACDIGAYEVEVAGQPLSAWVTGLTPHTVICQNVTTGQVVTLSDHGTSWDCEAAGLGVSVGDGISLLVRGPVTKGATDVGGAVAGMTPSSGGCTNRTTGQSVTFQRMVGATAASCVAAGLKVHPGETVQLRVQGAAE